jgi:hypothetical protein
MNHGPWKGLPSANLLSSTTPTARTDHTFPYNRLGRVVKAIMRQQLGRPEQKTYQLPCASLPVTAAEPPPCTSATAHGNRTHAST